LSSSLLPKNIEVSGNVGKYNSNSIIVTPTTEAEAVGIIKRLNNKKSTGADGISDHIIKKCYPKITHA
jgi:hypothetical protein